MPLMEMPTTVSIGSWPVSSAVTSAMMSPMASMRSGLTPIVRQPMRTSVGASRLWLPANNQDTVS